MAARALPGITQEEASAAKGQTSTELNLLEELNITKNLQIACPNLNVKEIEPSSYAMHRMFLIIAELPMCLILNMISDLFAAVERHLIAFILKCESVFLEDEFEIEFRRLSVLYEALCHEPAFFSLETQRLPKLLDSFPDRIFNQAAIELNGMYGSIEFEEGKLAFSNELNRLLKLHDGLLQDVFDAKCIRQGQLWKAMLHMRSKRQDQNYGLS